MHGSDLSSLHKHVDKNCLPEDYGGTKPKIDYSGVDWYPIFVKYNDLVKSTSIQFFISQKSF